MKPSSMDNKYVRIAELSGQIERVNEMITMHQQASDNQSMVRQYTFKRNELITELEVALQSLQLKVRLVAV